MSDRIFEFPCLVRFDAEDGVDAIRQMMLFLSDPALPCYSIGVQGELRPVEVTAEEQAA